MKTHILFLLLLISQIASSKPYDIQEIEGDSVVLNKSTKIEEKLSFKSDLNEKYNGKEFIYVDDLKEPEPEKSEAPPPIPTKNTGVINAFGVFMSYIFPVLLGIIIVLIILKIVLGKESGFWQIKKASNKVADKLVYEDEDIHDTDFNKHLENAIVNKDFRLATRYYYLKLLKKMSEMKTIEYHKDKTNTEYLFEIKDNTVRTKFHEVSYIYTYVWYGEFPVDLSSFNIVEKKFNTLFYSIN